MTSAVGVLAVVLLVVLILGRIREGAWEQERRELVQRIQAPARAVAVQARREEAEPERRRYVPVALDDDEAMANAHGIELEDGDPR